MKLLILSNNCCCPQNLCEKIEATGKHVELKTGGVFDSETKLMDFDLSALNEYKEFGADLIVLKFGENADETQAVDFGETYSRFIRFLNPKGASKVFCIGHLYNKPELNKEIETAAIKTGSTFVPLNEENCADKLFEAMNTQNLFSKAIVTPIPKGETPCSLYKVTVDGQNANCYSCRVSAVPFNRPYRGKERPISQSEEAAFLSFDMVMDAEITVTAPKDFKRVTIRPQSKGIKYVREGNTIRFTIAHPGQFSVEFDDRHNNLHIFANPVSTFKKEDADIYFGPGVHKAGIIKLTSGQTLMIDAGAVVHGQIIADHADNVKIVGRGVVDYSTFSRGSRHPFYQCGIINLINCNNVVLDGVILKDSSWWTLTTFNCVGISINNVKNIGMWRYNADGFDFANTQNVRITNCFLRNFDDCIVLKGFRFVNSIHERMNVENYIIENCVVWCDWGGALEIGAETVADEYSNIIFRNCDIIRNDDGGCRIQSSDRAHIHNVSYDDIRIEYDITDRPHELQESDDHVYTPSAEPFAAMPIRIVMYRNVYSRDNVYGHVSNISYRNIALIADEGVPIPMLQFYSADEEHFIEGVTIENITFNGKKLSKEDFNIHTSEWTKEIKFK